MFSPKLLKFHISFICKLCYHIYMITFLCSFNSSPPGSHPLPKITNVPVVVDAFEIKWRAVHEEYNGTAQWCLGG